MTDRRFFALMAAVVIAAALFVVYILFSVEQRDIQIVTQYAAFGESHFYKSRWFYLYNFAAFGLVVGIVHSVVMAQLYKYERRTLGVMFGWLTLLLFLIAIVYVQRVLQVAYL